MEEKQIEALKSKVKLAKGEKFIACVYGREIRKFKKRLALTPLTVGTAAAANIKKDLEGSYRVLGLTNQRLIIGAIVDSEPDSVDDNVLHLDLKDISVIKIKGIVQKHIVVSTSDEREYHLLIPRIYLGQSNHKMYLRRFLTSIKEVNLPNN